MAAHRNVLTPEALAMMDVIARTGSFAAAARELGKVPSSLTYSVRQLEDALDVLLFDRRSRQARLTPAGEELLAEGRRLLEQMDAVANRVRRVATGWEAQLTVAVDGVLSRVTILELCESFLGLCPPSGKAPASSGLAGPGTRLRLRTEVMAGTWEVLATGQADLAIGVGMGRESLPDVHVREIGRLEFVFAVAPHHPLAKAQEPISDAELMRHRAVAVADSAQRLVPYTVNLLPGQDVLTVSSMQIKLDVQLRCLACGFVPEPLAREHIRAGRLVVKPVVRSAQSVMLGYGWRGSPARGSGGRHRAETGQALRWWLAQLDSATTRKALLDRHAEAGPSVGL